MRQGKLGRESKNCNILLKKELWRVEKSPLFLYLAGFNLLADFGDFGVEKVEVVESEKFEAGDFPGADKVGEVPSLVLLADETGAGAIDRGLVGEESRFIKIDFSG